MKQMIFESFGEFIKIKILTNSFWAVKIRVYMIIKSIVIKNCLKKLWINDYIFNVVLIVILK